MTSPLPTAIALLAIVALSAITHAAPWISDEGKAMQAAHEFMLGDFAARHAPEPTGRADAPGGRVLKRISLAGTNYQIDGDTELALPAGTERVAQFMRYFELHGTGLDSLGGIRLLPAAPKSNLNISTKTPQIYRVKVPALPVPTADGPRFRLAVSGKATVTRIDLVPFGGGIREEFDRAPYVNLGHEHPPTKIKLALDLEHELSIEGHTWLESDKWFRYYNRPSSLPAEMEKFALDRHILPGRQMFKFEPALERGYSPKDPKLKEDPARPGHADPKFWEAYHDKLFANLDSHGYPADMKFAMCFNDYPSFMSLHPNGRGTPKAEHFDAAAELVSGYLRNQIADSGRTATWWELKNEASIKAEWDYHWRKDTDSWGLLAEFHNTVADRVHKDVPGVKIIGPASAWMQVQAADFGLWRNQARFMDLTKDKLDAYSHHFYEDNSSLGAYDRRDRGYTNYLLGRLPATLDLFRAHMAATDNIKPMLITEFGALNIGGSNADYWLRLRSYSAMLVQFMARPHQLDLAVPFIFLHAPWDPTNAHSAFVPDGEGGFKETPCARYFDLWKDFWGKRLPISSPDRNVHAIATHSGKRVYIAISNMTNRRLEVDLATALPATQRRLYRLNDEIRYENGTKVNPAKIPLAVEETTVVFLELSEPLTPKGTIEQRSYFATKTVTKERDFSITLPTSDKAITAAELRIGLQNSGGLDAPIRGTINGQPFTHDTSWAKNVSNLFEQAIIPVPIAKLGAENRITISGLPESTIITEAHLHLHTTQPQPKERRVPSRR